MSATRTKSEFLNTIRSDREAWESLLATIPDERKTEPGLAGGWTVKDLMAHITVYERWTVEWLEPALEGEPPAWNYPDDDETLSMDERNQRFYEKNRDRPLSDIQRDAAEVYDRMIAAIERIPDDAINADIRSFSPPVGDYYDHGTTVRQAIDANAAEHYRHHTADVKAWLEE